MSSHNKSDPVAGCLIILVVGFIWLLFVTWPWWLLVPPAVAVLVFLFNGKARREVITCFRQEDLSTDSAKFRSGLMYFLFIIGAIGALVCMYAIGANEAEWWLVPLVLLILAFRLGAVSSKSSRSPRLRRAFSENMRRDGPEIRRGGMAALQECK
jgi:membrane protein YdbS with pleckstrin-like domain